VLVIWAPFELCTPWVVIWAQVFTCVCGCAAYLGLVCVALPNLTLCFLCDLNCKGERLQIVEIPRKREKESCGIQVDHWIAWKGLSATLVHWDATTWKVDKCYLAEPRDKNRVSLVLPSLWLFYPQELASKLLSCANTLITKFCGYLVFDFTGSSIHPL
jgi:hypothetical protein